jgi:hypothetical protein
LDIVEWKEICFGVKEKAVFTEQIVNKYLKENEMKDIIVKETEESSPFYYSIKPCSAPNYSYMVVTGFDYNGMQFEMGEGCDIEDMGRVYERSVKNAPYIRRNTLRSLKEKP